MRVTASLGPDTASRWRGNVPFTIDAPTHVIQMTRFSNKFDRKTLTTVLLNLESDGSRHSHHRGNTGGTSSRFQFLSPGLHRKPDQQSTTRPPSLGQ
jgi:hypothetical protein